GGYLLYAPLTLVEDEVTGNKVAFNAQLLYQSAATWKPQQVRLSWLVQVLNETYKSPEDAEKALAQGGGMGDNRVTVLHAYYSDFYLTGLNVREDRGVDMAIVYEDPATDANVNHDDALLQMMNGLDNSFMVNRDCDFVDNQGACVGNGQRDITIPAIKQRWDSQSNSGVTEGQRWGIPANRLRVETYSFAHEDEATIHTGTQHAPAILNSRFTGTGATKPSLLFVRESRFRARNVDVRAAGSSIVTWTGNSLTLSLRDQPEIISGGYNLAPYQFVSGSNSWARQTPQEYVSELERRYPATQIGASTTPTVTLGDQITLVMVTTNAIQGNQTVLSQNGSSGLGSALTSNGSIRLQAADINDEHLRRSYIAAAANIAAAVPYLAVQTMLNSTLLSNQQWADITESILSKIKISTGLLPGEELSQLESVLKLNRYTGDSKIEATARYRQLAVAPILIFSAIGILLTNVKGGQSAGEIILSAVSAVSTTLDAVSEFSNVYNTFRSVSYVNISQIKGIESMVLSFRHSLSSSAAKSGAIGAAIGIVVSWAFFFAAWGKGGLSTDSIAFNALLAGALATTLTLVLTFFLSLSVIGAIVLAVVAIFDLIALIICKAGVKAACSLGITEALTKLITEWIYTGGVMIDTKADPAITNIEDAEMQLTDPAKGLVTGNSVRFTVDLWTYVRHLAPEPGIIYHYGNFFTPEDLRSTTVKYSLDNAERKIPADLNQTSWADVISYGWVEAEVPSPVVGWLVPTVKSKNLYQAARSDTLTSGVYEFSTPRINQILPLYLNTGLALPRYDCWFQVCKHKAAKSSVSTDLGKSFVLDILPNTLDGFMTWTALGTQIDPDGDGLGATIDPNPAKWDTDDDGVPDGVEYEYGVRRGYGFSPTVADADNDGLNDAAEIRYETNPRKADSDGDGVSDFDEVNGYVLTLGGLTVFVTSDPNQRDTDLDGMSDGVERRLNGIDAARYAFNPRVVNDPPARLYTTIDDEDRVFAVSQSTTVTTTVINGTAAEDPLLAAGTFTSSLPSQLGGAAQTRNFNLLPTT
ncbi:MAG: hypothetical protein KDD84_17655, partial [Caldilineaceae bacterium]|nr:hypothetical protein [Caldilineaceae bacterium]